MIESYIKDKIDFHKEKHNIQFSDEKVNEILSSIKDGIYAFQLIYDEKYQVILVRPLQYNQVIQNKYSGRFHGQNLWSYDGGKQFKYSLSETLKFDIQKIRDLQLDIILR
jgi:hypothetical protein